jgi:hypothetical protein
LLPAIQIKVVLEQTFIRDIREASRATPANLNGAFENSIQRIKKLPRAPKSRQALAVIHWVFLAKRQLKVEELCHALAVRTGDKTLDSDCLPSEKALLDGCLGLVTIDEDTSYLRLVHKSLQDHLETQFNQGAIFEDGHKDIATTCLAYMGLERYSSSFYPSYAELLKTFPFLEYSLKH